MNLADELNKTFFGGTLGEDVLSLLRPADHGGPEVRAHLRRVLRFASESGLGGADVSPLGLSEFADGTAEARIPGVMLGFVPPITIPGRHDRIDRYVCERSVIRGSGSPRIVGCSSS